MKGSELVLNALVENGVRYIFGYTGGAIMPVFDEIEKTFDVLDAQSHHRFIVQVAGTSNCIDEFIRDVGDDKIVEIARSGFTALEK